MPTLTQFIRTSICVLSAFESGSGGSRHVPKVVEMRLSVVLEERHKRFSCERFLIDFSMKG